MARYAIVRDSDNMVQNVIVWDGVTPWTPPNGTTAIEDSGGNAIIFGWYEIGVGFRPPMPKISGVNPGSGSTAGGTTVIISGLNLNVGDVVIKFDGVVSTNITNQTSSSLSCDTPAHDAGTVDVTVENDAGSWAGQNILSNGYEYTS